MKLHLALAGAALIFVAGCAGPSGSNSSVPRFNPVTDREELPGTTVKIDGEDFTVRRQKLTYRDGRTTIGWALLVDGRTISCPSPTEAGCRKAFEDAQKNPLIDDGGEGGMY